MTWDYAEKNEIRSEICKLDIRRRKDPYGTILLLPGESCLDVKELLSSQAINSDTFVVAVEREPVIAAKIEETLSSLGFKRFVVINKELHEVELPEGEKFDFAYLDTCGQLNPKILCWLAETAQRKVFAHGCPLTIAVSNYTRIGFATFEEYEKFLQKSRVSYNRLISGIPKIKPHWVGIGSSEDRLHHHRIMGKMVQQMFGPIHESWVYKNDDTRHRMHVFQLFFDAHRPLKGVVYMVRFLNFIGESPELIARGVRAATKRFGTPKALEKRGRPKLKAPIATKVSKKTNTSLDAELVNLVAEHIKSTNNLSALVNKLLERVSLKT